jgi:hypothetical protein
MTAGRNTPIVVRQRQGHRGLAHREVWCLPTSSEILELECEKPPTRVRTDEEVYRRRRARCKLHGRGDFGPRRSRSSAGRPAGPVGHGIFDLRSHRARRSGSYVVLHRGMVIATRRPSSSSRASASPKPTLRRHASGCGQRVCCRARCYSAQRCKVPLVQPKSPPTPPIQIGFSAYTRRRLAGTSSLLT